ncbi:hypothetical protein JRO89_XSUnG0195800 [Xanthoceras sorbifolium]|uniref:Lipid droplet-associated hydrolase n=1 Tax=Xanthoceras sorbifolium TaxID=99658 RepID=A0ABQ8GXT4_9ROSI|nr:hypothetical protein JRO89_XSUnG0195800 [Xanthoceras sorbifolium]
MLVSLLAVAPAAALTPTPFSRLLSFRCRKNFKSYCTSRDMGLANLGSKVKKAVNFRLCNVSSYTTELLEIQADNPTLHVLLIPGNPGVITFYKDFLESLYELLGGSASITAIGHIAQTKKQSLILLDSANAAATLAAIVIDTHIHTTVPFELAFNITISPFLLELGVWKMDFIRQELPNNEVPVILVGHSIGSYISVEMLRRCSEKVMSSLHKFDTSVSSFYFSCGSNIPTMFLSTCSVVLGDILYWTLSIFGVKSTISTAVYYRENCSVNLFSIISNIASISLLARCMSWLLLSSIISAALSHIVASLGFLPSSALRFVVSKSLGSSWSAAAVEAACTHLPQLSETPDWAFMRGNQDKIAFLFGIDDHWGPLQMFEEIAKQAPDIALSIEREGHTHAFCCTQAGSLWVADYVTNLIKNKTSSSSQ